MGRAPCCSKVGLHRGPWTPREDTLLTKYIQAHGEGHWRSMPKKAGLLRCGKSCRLRWMNYLRPDIKRGNITPDEDDLIIKLHALLGNRWSLIAGRLPGRTDNEIKNYWNTHLSKKFTRIQETQPNTHKKLSKPAKEVKRQKNMKMKNNRQKNKRKEIVEPEEKPKIHVPKPSRVTSFAIPRNDSFEYYNTESGKEVGFGTEGLDDPWCGLKNCDTGFGFLVGDDQDHDFVNCSNSDHLPTVDDNTLEKLYDEYFQLLKTEEDQVLLDSFAESLLV